MRQQADGISVMVLAAISQRELIGASLFHVKMNSKIYFYIMEYIILPLYASKMRNGGSAAR